ncbi:hypothetical protein Z968_11795 [Clostridium novyi A str. 4552]|uniref:HNH nuclease domain-containing protein n=1 Tax=Clostridium novyi A str. 4552 TaxID=1444289 RepID=A0A0A0I3U4_CLONO|nr:HNH endonuclease signature motif containing protein [Clostridium novyi]KGM94355.1 hypothetical protein Z968_11795 [Clostridium novyi A str. 4552]
MCKRKYTAIEQQAIQNVRETQPHVCYYCHKSLSDKEITIDHIQPYSRGGQTTEDNLVIACYHCNKEKSNMNLEEYQQYLRLKNKASKSVDTDTAGIELSNLYVLHQDINRDFNIAKNEYKNMLESIFAKPVWEDYAHYRLQKLQFLMWQYNTCKAKKERIEEAIEIQQQIVDLLNRKREIAEANATEKINNMLGKLRIDVVKRKLCDELNIDYEFQKYPNDTESVVNINLIKIQEEFKATPPTNSKMKYREQYYRMFGRIDKAITLDENNVLLNGYSRYLLLKYYRAELVPVKYVKSNRKYNVTTNIVGNNNNVNINF